jgi:4-hydroxyphenylacetate 3-monooxygenase/anthranilate 3-monooxygenase (FAD)/4-hydroxyphenylacetate 3-monooxygenase
MTARTGGDYLAGLKDSREVWLGASRVDVTTHPAFEGSLSGMSGYFDWQHLNAGDCLATDPQSGELMNATVEHTQSGALAAAFLTSEYTGPY